MEMGVAVLVGHGGIDSSAVDATPRETSLTLSRTRIAGVAGLRWGATTRLLAEGPTVLERTWGALCFAPPPLPVRPLPPTLPEEDPVARFFSFSDSGRDLSPQSADCTQLEMENAMLEALVTLLAFENGGRSPPCFDVGPTKLESPEMLPCLLPCTNHPAKATMGFQIEAVS
ncbi:hypothetical protein D1007_48544 [Hordeum vulgare]|nr:hypothetical protein D1007_48544 [Hordeum vulgare]